LAQPDLSPFAVLIALTTINHLSFSMVRLAVVLYAVHLHASTVTVGVLMAIFGAFSALTSMWSGRWVDRIGPRKPMLLGSAAMVAGAALAFVWRDLAALYIVSAVVGTLFNVFFIAYQLLLGQLGRPEDRVRNFGASSTAISVSIFVAPLVTGFAIDGVGHAETFLLAAALPLIPLAVIGMNGLKFPPASTGKGRATGPAGESGVLQLLRPRDLRRIFSFALLINITWNLFSFLMPLYCLKLGFSASSIGVVLGSYALSSIASRALAAPLSRYLAPWQLLIISGVVSAACFIGFALAQSFVVLTAIAFVLGLGMGMANPISQVLMYDAAPGGRIGEVMGMRVLIGNTVQTVMPLISGAIGAALGMAPIFWALAATQMASCYWVRRMWRSRMVKPQRMDG
jgi:MFS family permease